VFSAEIASREWRRLEPDDSWPEIARLQDR